MQQLYFIALIPPTPIFDEAQKLKEQMANDFNSKGALKSPPHITLHMPFKLKQAREEELIEALTAAIQYQPPFEIKFNNFGHFGERVIYINVEKSDTLVTLGKTINQVMKRQFNIFNADYKSRGYNPHLTIAFRDLKKQAFAQAWPIFENLKFEATYSTQSISVLKHDGKQWQILKNINLAAL